jgi:outer membrane immunogenic protein
VKKHLLGSIAFIALGIGVPAMAADMPVKAPRIAPVPYYNWSGCHVGVHVGGGWGHKDFTDRTLSAFPSGNNFGPPGGVVQVDVSGAIGGGQFGCDYQLAPNWVAGAEVDFSFADIKGAAVDPFFDNKNLRARTHWLATATGRLGYTMDRTMIYAKGGAAWSRDRYDVNGAATGFVAFLGFPDGHATAAETRAGWTVGFGIERAIWDDWSIKLEFDHYEFGTRRVTLFDPNYDPTVADIRQRIDAVKIGVNYRFGAPGPVSARY